MYVINHIASYVSIGKLCIEVEKKSKIAFISESLCNGCGICVKVLIVCFCLNTSIDCTEDNQNAFLFSSLFRHEETEIHSFIRLCFYQLIHTTQTEMSVRCH